MVQEDWRIIEASMGYLSLVVVQKRRDIDGVLFRNGRNASKGNL